MPAYLLRIRYDGREFHGVVPQKNVRTIIGELMEVLGIKKYRYNIVSRTDKGVNAEENYLVLETNENVNWENFYHDKIKIDKIFLLKRYINIRKFSKGKLYEYTLPKSLFDEKYIFKPKYLIIDDYKIEIKWKDDVFSIERYKEGTKKFIGKHNFENFAKGSVKNGICTIYKFEVKEEEKYWVNYIEGNRFLYEMIRRIISFLVAVGKNRFPIDKIDLVLSVAKLDPKPPAAPAEFLTLKKVYLNWTELYRYIKEVIK